MISLETWEDKGPVLDTSMKVDTWPWPCPTSEKGIGSDGLSGPHRTPRRQTYLTIIQAFRDWRDFASSSELWHVCLWESWFIFFKRWSVFEVTCLLAIMYQVVPRRTRALNVFRPSWAERSICTSSGVVPTIGSNPLRARRKSRLLSPHWSESHLFQRCSQLEHNGPPLG